MSTSFKQQDNSAFRQRDHSTINQQDNSLIKDSKDWKSGDDPATPSQQSYLETLAEQTSEQAPTDDLTKAEASEEIDRLRKEAGLD